MTLGYDQSKATIDSRSGEICQSLKRALYDVQAFEAFLATKQASDLVALGYTSAEATTLKTNFGVLDQFRQAFQGLQAIPAAVDIRPYMVPFTGVN